MDYKQTGCYQAVSYSEFLKNHLIGTVLKIRFSFYGAREQQNIPELY